MSIKEQEYWKVDLHVHAAKPDDAINNTSENLEKVFRYLLEHDDINVISILQHDNFPVETARYLQEKLNAPVIIGNEVTARSKIIVKYPGTLIKVPMAHIIGLFQEKPEHWPYKDIQWPKKRRDKLGLVFRLPEVEDVINTIKDNHGVAVIAHPSSLPLPWGSMGRKEILYLLENGYLGNNAAIECNSHWAFRLTNGRFFEICKKNNIAMTGGSDTHDPRIESGFMTSVGNARITTKYQKRVNNPFEDLEHAVNHRTTMIVDYDRGQIYP